MTWRKRKKKQAITEGGSHAAEAFSNAPHVDAPVIKIPTSSHFRCIVRVPFHKHPSSYYLHSNTVHICTLGSSAGGGPTQGNLANWRSALQVTGSEAERNTVKRRLTSCGRTAFVSCYLGPIVRRDKAANRVSLCKTLLKSKQSTPERVCVELHRGVETSACGQSSGEAEGVELAPILHSTVPAMQ